jgi:hypothetical protein
LLNWNGTVAPEMQMTRGAGRKRTHHIHRENKYSSPFVQKQEQMQNAANTGVNATIIYCIVRVECMNLTHSPSATELF